jgi:hypothetical protein
MRRTSANGMKWSAGYEYRDGVGENKTQKNMYDDNVRKLEFKFDIEKLKTALDEILQISNVNRMDQICLTYAPTFPHHPDGHEYQGAGSLIYEYYKDGDGVKSRPRPEGEFPPEISFTDFVPKFKHTYFYHVWKTLSTKYKLGRMRFMKLVPTQCYTWHMDPTEHIHVPLVTNPGNKLVIGDNTYFLPADGSSYATDTTKLHTAFNGGKEDRYNLLINILDGMDTFEIEMERSQWCHDVDVIRYNFYGE